MTDKRTKKRKFYDALLSGLAWSIMPSIWLYLVCMITFPDITFGYFADKDLILNSKIASFFKGGNYLRNSIFVILMIAVDSLFVFTKKGVFRRAISLKYILLGLAPVLVYALFIYKMYYEGNNGGISHGVNFIWLFNCMGIALVFFKVIIIVTVRSLDKVRPINLT